MDLPRIEEKTAQLDPPDEQRFLSEQGPREARLDRLIRAPATSFAPAAPISRAPKEAALDDPGGHPRAHPGPGRERTHPSRKGFIRAEPSPTRFSWRWRRGSPPRTQQNRPLSKPYEEKTVDSVLYPVSKTT